MKRLSRLFYVPAFLAAMLAIAAMVCGSYGPPTAKAQSSVKYDDLPDFAEFVVDGRKWNHTNLTYFFQNGTSDIFGDGERQAVRDGLALWAGVTSLTFTEVSNAASADIVILWGAGEHGDGIPFDGVNGVLAHAFFPPPNGGSLAGDAHFDDAETWTLSVRSDSNQPIDMVTVAAHEIGHSLGLGHSQVPGALMYPFYSGSHRFLDQDDIDGIRSIYPPSPGVATQSSTLETADYNTVRNQPGVSSYFTAGPAGQTTNIAVNRTGRYVRVQLTEFDYLSLAEVRVLNGSTNLALGRPAHQYNTGFGGDAARAVDGNTDGNWANNSVTHTYGDYQNWWQVDLGSVQAISTIEVWNRTDCCSERLRNFYVFVSDVPFQGSTANKAVDGNTDGFFWNGSVSHTNYEYQPWWQVDLGSSRQLSTIRVWNRTDCCTELLGDFYLFVSDAPFQSTDLTTTINQPGVSSYYMAGPAGRPTTFTINRMGRYLRIQRVGTSWLSVAEVQVQ